MFQSFRPLAQRYFGSAAALPPKKRKRTPKSTEEPAKQPKKVKSKSKDLVDEGGKAGGSVNSLLAAKAEFLSLRPRVLMSMVPII